VAEEKTLVAVRVVSGKPVDGHGYAPWSSLAVKNAIRGSLYTRAFSTL